MATKQKKATAAGSLKKASAPRNSRKKIGIIIGISLASILLIAGIVLLVIYLNSVRPIAQTKEEARVIGTCDGTDICYDELRYVTLLYADMLEKTYGEGIWNNEETAEQYYGELREAVLSALRNNYAAFRACRYYNIDYKNSAISDAVQDKVEQAVKECGSTSKYRDQLKQMHLTDHVLRLTLTAEMAQNELFYQVRDFIGSITVDSKSYPFFGKSDDPNEYKKFYEEYLTDGNMVAVDYLYIQNDAGEDKEENRALAAAYREELLAADPDDRAELLGKILGSDINCTVTGIGPYFIVQGTYTQDFWNAVSVLKNTGDVSDLIETENGYYVAVRVSYSESNLLLQLSSLLQEYQGALIESFVEEQKEGLAIELNDLGKSLNLLDIIREAN